jgi:4-hydroxyphenylpyruvate dioxygenase-like putative hemolysin
MNNDEKLLVFVDTSFLREVSFDQDFNWQKPDRRLINVSLQLIDFIKKILARPERFELPTLRFEGRLTILES